MPLAATLQVSPNLKLGYLQMGLVSLEGRRLRGASLLAQLSHGRAIEQREPESFPKRTAKGREATGTWCCKENSH